MENLINRLEKRGWNKKEISDAVEKIHNAKQLKTPETRFLEKRIYWILLVVIAVSNFAISIALIPVLIALRGLLLYSAVVVLGISFGLLLELVIRSIEQLEKKHHLFLAILIPMTAFINFFIIGNISNNLSKILNLRNIQSSISVAAVYAASFVLPYIIYRFVLKIGYYAKE